MNFIKNIFETVSDAMSNVSTTAKVCVISGAGILVGASVVQAIANRKTDVAETEVVDEDANEAVDITAAG